MPGPIAASAGASARCWPTSAGACRRTGPGRTRRGCAGRGGGPPDGTGQDSAGTGAAMRIAPLALSSPEAPHEDARHEAVMAASLMTHRDIRSLAGAMAVVHAIIRLADGADRNASFLFRVA